MAIVISGKTKCVICAAVIEEGDEIVGFPAFLPKEHELWQYSDAAFHKLCFQAWPDRERFQALYDAFNDIQSARPKHLKTLEEFEAWTQEAYEGFLKKLRANDINEAHK